ncbi:DNA glycosylase AlkZ-like family protein [Corynebacterium sp. A21]|uniref:DNA glycosylase AlkZ-like family protein n=1 Tax=Corynebacterium sp. A21 TaxID=3457318 RepID=UPI003FD328D8
MDPHADLAELRARRLIAQGLAPTAAREPLDAPVQAARHMLALQGQNHPAGIRAIALRAGVDLAEVLAAVDKREIIRAWPQRGTLHFMAAEDARWMMKLGLERVARAQALRRPQLGITDEQFETARGALHARLRELGGEPLPRPQVYELFASVGIPKDEGRGPHLIRAFGGEGEVVQGPKQGRHETFLHIEDLPVPQRVLEGDAALAELGTRYFHAHGPATVKDLIWWAGLTVKDAARAAALARDVVEIELAGVTYVMGTWQLKVSEAEQAAALKASYELPAFDEYLLGYAFPRAEVVTAEIAPTVLTKNGISWGFNVEDGVITGRTG